MLKTLSTLTLLAIASAALAQSTPSVTPSQTPSVTPSQSPSVTPSQTPSITPAPLPQTSVGGLSRCQNLIGIDRDKCMQDERAGAGSTSGSGMTAPYSTSPGSAPTTAPSTAPSTPSTPPTAPTTGPTGGTLR